MIQSLPNLVEEAFLEYDNLLYSIEVEDIDDIYLNKIEGSEMMDDNETVTITKKRLDDLEESQRLLISLENAGVNNWDGYECVMDEYNEIN